MMGVISPHDLGSHDVLGDPNIITVANTLCADCGRTIGPNIYEGEIDDQHYPARIGGGLTILNQPTLIYRHANCRHAALVTFAWAASIQVEAECEGI